MKRAVVVFLDSKPDQIKLFKCLYASFEYIKSSDTSLVVFGEASVMKWVPKNCIKVPVQLEDDPAIYSEYPYIYSLSSLTKKEASILLHFDWILKTDVDTFLTPAWNSFHPTGYTVGKGAYASTKEVKSRIKEISNQFNLRHQGRFNIGSTHYGKPSLLLKVADTATELTKYLLLKEFSINKGAWPSWYYGVCSLYASDIAVNHHVDNISISPNKLDHPSTSPNSIYNHPHIHCWHTEHLFSKFAYLRGDYDNTNLKKLDLNKVHDYCLYNAIATHG
ncbi:DUF7164 domain-containing protein [Virgibacillus halodenitrificans]|uniref:DUF7164 domain-containing protein n=1 Tax=Virgibacillus halodenitrificans TaxID=1482 RepID=A0ABR7VGR0_VIRHA|nr:hypothetical protein [Virgibacillus halodenitrificans]MBD1221127.1 hypothetical protein [Virgibacillus halodenitrificans]